MSKYAFSQSGNAWITYIITHVLPSNPVAKEINVCPQMPRLRLGGFSTAGRHSNENNRVHPLAPTAPSIFWIPSAGVAFTTKAKKLDREITRERRCQLSSMPPMLWLPSLVYAQSDIFFNKREYTLPSIWVVCSISEKHNDYYLTSISLNFPCC